MRLIDGDALKADIKEKRDYLDTSSAVGRGEYIALNKSLTMLDEQKTVDAVPVKSIEQLKWERDTAIQQLEEHGIPFCGKADVVAVVRCKDCKHFKKPLSPDMWGWCKKVSMDNKATVEDWYCSDGERRKEDDLRMCANHNGERREEDAEA